MIIKINGKECECEKGEYLLTVARRNGFEIPTLCHHAALPEGQGSCRVCIVEVTERGKKKIVVSCVYPITGEIEVETDSEKVRRERGMILTLLAKRAPESPEIKALCEKYNAPEISRFVKVNNEKCVMCGLCAKVCHVLAAGAISTVNRGITKAVSTPYDDPSESCLGCGACAYVCPTNAIDLYEDEEKRIIWHKVFKLVRCKECGAVIGTEEQMKEAVKRAGEEETGLCETCRKNRIADVFSRVYGYDL